MNLRGMIKVKGKGKMKTYWVGRDDLLSLEQAPHPLLVDPSPEREDEDDTDHSDLEEDPSHHHDTVEGFSQNLFSRHFRHRYWMVGRDEGCILPLASSILLLRLRVATEATTARKKKYHQAQMQMDGTIKPIIESDATVGNNSALDVGL